MTLFHFLRIAIGTSYVFISTLSFAQEGNKPYSDVTIASPTAASLGKYADIPVNYFTGVPQIEIPIYTVKEGTLSLPVTLSYHAGGLKVWETSSWVGTGWALNAGGVITRSVIGAPDEAGTNNAATETNGYYSDYGYYSYLYKATANGYIEDWEDFARGFRDGEPDIFFFNFNGQSGKFYFNDDHTPILVPESDLKITCNYPGGSQSISDFTITTSDGTKYYFGRTASTSDIDPIEMTGSVTAQGGLSSAKVISSWYLNKIQSSDGQFAINLIYSTESYGFHTIATFPTTSTRNGVYGDGSLTGYALVKNIVKGVRLSQITFSNNGIVNFVGTNKRQDLSDDNTVITQTETTNNSTNTGLEAKSLDEINIGDGTICKKYTFTYSYFADNITPLKGDFQTLGYNLTSDRKRLKLDQIIESSCNNSVVLPPYMFVYNTPTPPRRISFGVDHWGFYNGAEGINNGLIPDYYVDNTKTAGANRDANPTSVKCGILQKITYPTGGTTSFDFEANAVNNNYTVSGYYGLNGALNVHHNQTNLSQSSTVSVTQPGDIQVDITNYSTLWDAYFTLTNSSGIALPNTPIYIRYSSQATTFPLNFSASQMPVGDYTATLNFPSITQPNQEPFGNGATANFSQFQTHSEFKDLPVGGVRIKTISTNDGVSTQNTVTSYNYTTGSKSTGILYSRPTYIQSIRNDLVRDVGYWHPVKGFTPYVQNPNGCIGSVGGGAGLYYTSAGSLRPMATVNGCHIGYSSVIVSQTGNGFSTYEYQSPPSYNQTYDGLYYNTVTTGYCDPSIPNYPPAPIPFDPGKGDLIHESHNGEATGLVKETYYKTDYLPSVTSTPGFIVATRDIGGGTLQYLGTKYMVTSSKRTHTRTTETNYPSGYNYGGAMTTVTDVDYSSPYHHQPSVTTVTQIPATDILVTKYKSVFEFVPTSVSSITDAYPQYNIDIASCQTTYNTQKQSCSSIIDPTAQSQCYTDKYMALLACQKDKRITYITNQKTNFTNTSNQYQSKHDLAKTSNADASLKPILQLQDDYNNAPVEITRWRNGKLTDASYTNFTFGSVFNTTPSDKVYPYTIYATHLQTPISSFAPAVISNNGNGNSITKDGNYPISAETTLKFAYGNLVEVTSRSGVTNSYIWGYNNTLPIVKATGTDYTSLYNNYTSATINKDLTKLRNQYASSITQLSTYTYLPIVGMTNETDPSGKSMSYEYDPLMRLKVVRDYTSMIIKKMDYHFAGQTEISPTCACSDLPAGKKCVNGQCEQGKRVNTSTVKVASNWKCTYHYEWSDGSVSANPSSYSETNQTPCLIDN